VVLEEFSIRAADHLLLLSSISFDLTQKNIFAPLVVGARLTLSSAARYDARQLAQQLQEQQISLVNCTPSAFYPLVEASAALGAEALRSLRAVVLGGRADQPGRLQPWLSGAGAGTEVVNSYGPTECTDVVSYHRVTAEEVAAGSEVPLGRPIWNTQLWLWTSGSSWRRWEWWASCG